LLEAGLDDAAIRVRVRRGQLHRVHRAVYAVGHEAWNRYGHLMAAVLACGAGAVLSHFAAATLWGFWRWDGRDVDVIVPGARGRAQPGLRVHRTRCLDAIDVRRHYDIPATTAARTCLGVRTGIAA